MSIPIRVKFRDGQTVWRQVRELTHEQLCRALGLDVCRFRFDLANGQGFCLQIGEAEPHARIEIARNGERFRDVDPTCPRDFESFR